MASFTLFQNPRCAKSRATLALLLEHGVAPTIIEYLQDPPDKSQLKAILGKLGIKPEALVRKSEEVYKTKFAANP